MTRRAQGVLAGAVGVLLLGWTAQALAQQRPSLLDLGALYGGALGGVVVGTGVGGAAGAGVSLLFGGLNAGEPILYAAAGGAIGAFAGGLVGLELVGGARGYDGSLLFAGLGGLLGGWAGIELSEVTTDPVPRLLIMGSLYALGASAGYVLFGDSRGEPAWIVPLGFGAF